MTISIMKKGQKVRIKSSGKIGVIADSEFFHWGGRKHVRYEVKFDKQKDTVWYPKEELTTALTEHVKVTFSGEGGDVYLDVSIDHDKRDHIQVLLTGNPENLKKHNGLHVALACRLLEQLCDNS